MSPLPKSYLSLVPSCYWAPLPKDSTAFQHHYTQGQISATHIFGGHTEAIYKSQPMIIGNCFINEPVEKHLCSSDRCSENFGHWFLWFIYDSWTCLSQIYNFHVIMYNSLYNLMVYNSPCVLHMQD